MTLLRRSEWGSRRSPSSLQRETVRTPEGAFQNAEAANMFGAGMGSTRAVTPRQGRAPPRGGAPELCGHHQNSAASGREVDGPPRSPFSSAGKCMFVTNPRSKPWRPFEELALPPKELVPVVQCSVGQGLLFLRGRQNLHPISPSRAGGNRGSAQRQHAWPKVPQ